MSTVGDALNAIRSVLMLQERIASLGREVEEQGSRLSKLADAHADLRDRVARLEGVIDGVAMAGRQRRIEE